MLKLISILLAASAVLAGQQIIDPARREKAEAFFRKPENEAKLACSIRTLQPALSFSFRYQTGFLVEVPMKQYIGTGHSMSMLFRVTPKEGGQDPVYMVSAIPLPNIPIPKNNSVLEFSAGFQVGEGEYNIEFMLLDDSERVCRQNWHIKAQLKGKDRDLKLDIAPNTILDYSYRRRRPTGGKADAPERRFTIMLHAAPAFARSTRLRGFDRVMLMGTLASMLERLPAQQVKLVVFSLDKQREILNEKVDRRTFDHLERALNNLELGLVDINVLNNRKGHVDLLADLINEETEADKPTDAVIVLGPASRFFDKVPEQALEAATGKHQPFFYVKYKPPFDRSPDFPDSITHALRRVKGRMILVRSPGEFARAIEQIESSLQTLPAATASDASK